MQCTVPDECRSQDGADQVVAFDPQPGTAVGQHLQAFEPTALGAPGMQVGVGEHDQR